MKAFIPIVHGSRVTATADEFFTLCAKLQQQLPQHKVIAAFMSLQQPDIPTAMRQAAEAGCTEITLQPLFVLAGSHVRQDVPQIVEQCTAELQQHYPQLTCRLLPHIGATAGFIDAIITAEQS